MYKIFGYECRRLFCNRFFAGFVLALLFYGWQVLNRVTILGVSPYRPLFPLELWGLSEPDASAFVGGRPVFPDLFYLRRRAAAGRAHPGCAGEAFRLRTGSVLRCPDRDGSSFSGGGCPGGSVLWKPFSVAGLGLLVLPGLLTLVPPLVFALGSGWLLGRLRAWLIFPWMLLPVLLAALPLPEALGLWNGSLFAKRPLELGILDPAFSCQGRLLRPRGFCCWREPRFCCRGF